MAAPSSLAPVEPELLHATCTADGHVTFRNPAWETLFGAGASLWERLGESDQALAEQCLRDAAAGQLVTNQIFPVALKNRDEPLPVLLTFFPVHLPEAGGVPQVAAISIVGEALAEPTTWIASQTQRDRMANLGHMTMGIAHDFNNLLSGILGHTELMKPEVELLRKHPVLREYVHTIERAALDGAALIRKIQRYIRQEKQTDFEPVNLTALIRDCISLTRPYWYNEPRRKGISIIMKRKLDDVPDIHGSPTELREVLVNLILNAVQAMPQGGHIRFQTSYTPGTGVQVRVEDTGSGMPEDVRKRIFEPLFTTKGQHGTGMGLAVSYGIIQEHEGNIEVESEPGAGTTFILTFPPTTIGATSEDKPPAEAPHQQARILVVDDEEMVRNILAKLLGLRGHTITQAASGPEALERAHTEAFDLVFTDQAMPEMSGRDFARRLRTRFPDLPIVLLTGDTDLGTPDDDIDAVLSKPFKLDELDDTIQQILRERNA